ncbi:hypothetical protein PFBG_06189 [Plasmodium falciparum 7G8]|uniref:Uncharacterized protein n=1 Tax=Plasmodium falciparum (isolate 7G8) TaxID=57266 RepID=W7ESE1_PLAF8|nr:hypothetical protein PFBG_06189 [Plasmodium falciparum 7G8]
MEVYLYSILVGSIYIYIYIVIVIAVWKKIYI